MAGYAATAVMHQPYSSYADNDYAQPAFVPQIPTTPDSGRRTRSGRTVHRSESSSRVTKSTTRASNRSPSRARKPSTTRTRNPSPTRSRSRATKSHTSHSTARAPPPLITEPLSLLTAHSTIPIKDISAWVHRSAAVRQSETETRNGYVTRPMNSFMLYRSAYAERTKEWATQNNHQVVSQVVGQSWPLEPPDVKALFESYARIERDNHAAAHPTYKFSPSKNGPVARAKARARAARGDLSDEDSEDSASDRGARSRRRGGAGSDDDEESEDEYRPRRGRARPDRSRSRRARAPTAEPMTPPRQTIPFPSYDASPTPGGVQGQQPYALGQSWMVTTHDGVGGQGLPYTSSPDARAQGQGVGYGGYDFGGQGVGYEQQQQPLSYGGYQPQQMQSSYDFGGGLPQQQQHQHQQQQQQQGYYDFEQQQIHQQLQERAHDLGLQHNGYMPATHQQQQQQQSMYPELAVVPRRHAGMPDNSSGGGVADTNIDPALFQLEQGAGGGAGGLGGLGSSGGNFGGGGGGGNGFGSSHGHAMPQQHQHQDGQGGLEGWDQAFGNSFGSYA